MCEHHATDFDNALANTAATEDVKIPSHMLSNNASQDVFLVVHPDNVSVILVPSQHAGHKFFTCLAELNRTKFLKEFIQDPASRYTATLMVDSLCNNGKGCIYAKPANSSTGWRPIIQPRQATELIFRALLSTYSMHKPKTTPEQQQHPPPPFVSPENTPTNSEERKRCDSTMDAAEALLLVRSTSQEQHSSNSDEEGQKERLPPKKRVRFTENKEARSCDEQCQNAKKRLKTVQHEQQHEPKQPKSHGIPMTAITQRDVLCGESGQGLLNTTNPGNVQFHSLVHANILEFHNAADKRRMLDMAKAAVRLVHQAGGRFLVENPSTGLWHEVKLEKAWSKALRTFQAYEQAVKQRLAIQSLRESREKRDRAKQLSQAMDNTG